jgi:2,3-bisphosphoglycerate-independent phosphoglycerate mutase
VRTICVVLLDGVGDRGYPELGRLSSNEAGVTPNLDALCARGSCGLLWPLGPGRAPSSEVAHWAMLGYRPSEFPGRAVLEALGSGQEVDPGDVLAYAALRPAELRDGQLWLAGRPEPVEEEHARELVGSVARMEVGGFTFSLSHLGRGEAILRLSGGADDRVTDTDAFFRERDPMLRPLPLAPAAATTATAVERWSRLVHEGLSAHAGGTRLNVITLKWWGRARQAPTFAERHGLADARLIGSSPFLGGLARSLGMAYHEVAAGGELSEEIGRKLGLAEQAFADGADFVFLHTKASDEAGHTKEPRAKVDAIEALDRALGPLLESPGVVCVTGDHATPASPDVIHSGDPVPFVLAGPGVRADRVERFGELHCREGILGHLRGEDVMPVLLNAADRPLFLGSRPTPVSGALGHPCHPEPFEL